MHICYVIVLMDNILHTPIKEFSRKLFDLLAAGFYRFDFRSWKFKHSNIQTSHCQTLLVLHVDEMKQQKGSF